MNRLEEIKIVLYNELEKNCFGHRKEEGYDHLFGVCALCSFLAVHKHLDIELAGIIGLLHDCSTYIYNNSFHHAYRSSELAYKYLKDSRLFSDEEIRIVCNAIKNHSDKDKIHDEYSELIKDADVIHQYLQQSDALFSKDYTKRLEKYL